MEVFVLVAGSASSDMMYGPFVEDVVGSLGHPITPFVTADDGAYGLRDNIPPPRQFAIHPNEQVALPLVFAVAEDHVTPPFQWVRSSEGC